MEVILEARGGHDGAATGGHYGSWARIWASRENITKITIIKDEHSFTPGRLAYHKDTVIIDVVPNENFNEEKDYILCEHKRSPNPFLGGSSSREYYELLFGKKMPAWADFPKAWSCWVRNFEVQGSAIKHILKKVPTAKEYIEYAQRKTAKGTITNAWLEVAEHCEKVTGKKLGDIRGSGTWTAVDAMPIRIAQRLGGWKPPVPRPVYGERDAVLVASPYKLPK